MTLEITRLLEISPDSSLPEIRKAYHKRRREIDPDMTWQLEKLDTAYEQALIWFRQHPHDDPTSARSPHSEHLNPERPAQQRMPVNATCSELQRQAMELLGAAPGCDLKAAAGIARRKGVPEDDILRACELISTMPGSSGALHLPVQALWKVLAALPALIAFGLYNLLFGSGVDFFPGHSYPEMARWFSGTLLASSVTAAVYTIAVPLLLLLIVRRLRRGRRACKHYRITPASRSVLASLSARVDLLIFLFSLFISFASHPFYRNTVRYAMDYENMANERYVSAQAIEPDLDYRSSHGDFGMLYRLDNGQTVQVRDNLYMREEVTGYDQGWVHEVSLSYLPHTGLAHDAKVLSYELYTAYLSSDGECLETSYTLNCTVRLQSDGELVIYRGSFYDSSELDGAELLNRFDLARLLGLQALSLEQDPFLLFDSASGRIQLLTSVTDPETGAAHTALAAIDAETGQIVQSALLENWTPERLFLLDNGDLCALLFYSLYGSSYYSSGARAAAVLLDGETLSPLSMTEDPLKFASFYDCTVGSVSENGMEVTLSQFEKEETFLIPIP